jgi:hydroxymethylbilane synthase
VGIECREGDERINALLAPLIHDETAVRVKAERALNNRLNGGCQVPVAGFAELQGDNIRLRGLIGYPDGSVVFRSEKVGAIADAESLGVAVAEDLLAQGGRGVLESIGIHVD